MATLIERDVHDRGIAPTDPDAPITITRRRVDRLLVSVGSVVAAVLLVAGILLTWGARFADDYVRDELAAQNISFPPRDSLIAQGRADLAGYGGEQVTTGGRAEAYASYIQGHVEGIADGLTYAELGAVERTASAAVSEALAAGAGSDVIAELEAEAAVVTAQRDAIFRGEMLRGALLGTYAWSTLGRIAWWAAVAAYAAAAVMLALVVAGMVRLRQLRLAPAPVLAPAGSPEA